MAKSKEERIRLALANFWNDPELAIEQLKLEGLSHEETLALLAKVPTHKKAGKQGALKSSAKKISMASVELEAIHWLWEKRIPLDNVTIFAGDPGIGKSLMALDLIGRGSIGKDFLDGAKNEVGRFKSILLAMEDDRATILVPRLTAMGADLTAIDAVDMVETKDGEEIVEQRLINLEYDLAVIDRLIQDDPDVKLLMIDPISNYMGSKNMHKDQELRSILFPLLQLAQARHIAVLVIMHNSKQIGRSALAKVAVSLGGIGIVRIAWSFVEEEEHCLMLQMKKNLGKFSGIKYTTESVSLEIKGNVTSQARMKFLEDSSASIDNVLSAKEDPEERKERPAYILIKNMLPQGGEVAAKAVQDEAERLGISYKQLRTARAALDVVPFQKKGKQGWFWRYADRAQPSGPPHPADDPDLPF